MIISCRKFGNYKWKNEKVFLQGKEFKFKIAEGRSLPKATVYPYLIPVQYDPPFCPK